jgi:hypothetical protein
MAAHLRLWVIREARESRLGELIVRWRMQNCDYCHKELEAKARICPHCGKAYPTGRPIYTFPSVIIAFLVCCGICFGYFHMLAGFSDWLSAVLSIPVVLIFFAVMVKLASWSDCSDRR